MPPLPPVPGVLRVTQQFAAETLTPLIVAHFQYTGGPPSVIDCQTIATNWGAGTWAAFNTFYPTDFSWGLCTVTDISSPTSSVGEANIALAGTATSAALPGQVCMLIHKTIARRYRGGHPRTYLPAFATEFKLNDRQWTAAAAVSAGHGWGSAVGTVTTGGPYGTTNVTNEVNVSYRTGNAPRPPTAPFVIDVIIGVDGEQNMATQRRRLKRAA